MDRELKFRAWDNEHKQMVYGFEVAIGEECFLDPTEYTAVMQYTGLKDKNGIEIYEGDIMDCDVGGRYVVVNWFEPQACFDTKPIKVFNKNFVALKNSAWEYRCEVIGNIYENPELIEKEEPARLD